jgi:RNA polymerase sigma factor (sigma-70 family)
VNARQFLEENLALVERVVAYTCRAQRLDDAEAEEFASIVKLRLIENDYAIIRKFAARSSFATYLAVVVQRMLLDHRIHLWGKWHTSSEAKRLGETAVALEILVHRDGRTLDEALGVLRQREPSLTRAELESLLGRLPARAPKRRLVDLEEAQAVGYDAPPPERDSQRVSDRLSPIIRAFIDGLPADERLILQLRFDSGMTIAEIARSLHLDPKQLYRRIQRRLDSVRAELENAGVGAEDVDGLIGARGIRLEFELRNKAVRPSTDGETTNAGAQEEIQR